MYMNQLKLTPTRYNVVNCKLSSSAPVCSNLNQLTGKPVCLILLLCHQIQGETSASHNGLLFRNTEDTISLDLATSFYIIQLITTFTSQIGNVHRGRKVQISIYERVAV